MKREDYSQPSQAAGAEPRASARFSVSRPDEQGNSFITVLGDDGAPLPAHEPTRYDREGA